MEPEGSWPHSQVPTTCPCPEPATVPNKQKSLKVGNKTGVDYTMTFSKQVPPEDFATKFLLRI